MRENNIPQAPDIERAVLCEMILEPELIAQVISTGDNLFYKPQNTLIFKALDFLHIEGINIDQLTLTEQLRKQDNLDKVGEAVLARIVGEIYSTANFKNHLEILKEKAAMRELLYLAITIKKTCNQDTTDPAEIVSNIETQLTDIKEIITKEKLSIAERVREWILLQDRDFSVTDCYKDLCFVTPRDKSACRTAIKRMVGNVIEPSGNRLYRLIDTTAEVIDYLNASTEEIEIVYPFEIEKFVETYPGNIIVVAGEANAGKTAFLLNFIKLNMFKHEIHYFSSEMGASELRKCLNKFNDINLEDWKNFFPYKRSSNFADVVKPDSVNLIDFLEIHDEFYKVGGYLKEIHDKLQNGIVIIAIQKNPGTDHGLGGARGLEKPRLYLAMEPSKLKIVKAKNWKTETNPNNMEIEFKLVQGCKFIPDDSGWAYGEKSNNEK